MREIKYRAWDKNSQHMLHWDDIYGVVRMDSGVGIHEAVGDQSYLLNCILMQYTGLKDKNGKEIYEGDVFETHEGLFQVIWLNDFASFGMEYLKRKHLITLLPESEDMKVIGNIYENHELLEDKEST